MVHADIVYIRHIIDAITRIREYLHGIDEVEFRRNYLVQDGVIRQLEIIGEATKQISQGTRDVYPNIPWKDMAGMRDKLIHDYFGVDVDQVWLTACNDIPVLEIEIKEVLANLQ